MSPHDKLLDPWEREDRTPRESCLRLLKLRRELRGMLPGTQRRVGKFDVQRTMAYQDHIYRINGVKLTLDQAVDIVAENAEPPKRKPKAQRPDKLPEAPAPRVFVSAIDYRAPIATVQISLF